MKKIIAVFLVLVFLLSSCAAADRGDAQTTAPANTEPASGSASDVPETDPPETEPAQATPPETEPLAEPLLPEPQARAIFVQNSVSAPLILLPYHDADDIPQDFVLAMQNNPIDRDFRQTCWEDPQISSIGPAYEHQKYYESVWQGEIDRTVDQIVAYWGEDYRTDLETYAMLSVAQADFLAIEVDLFYNEKIDFGRYMLALNGLNQSMNACRNTAFMLKYILYLTERKMDGKAEQSMQFAFRTDAGHDYDETYIPIPRGTCLIPMTLSPSFTTESGDAFAQEMKDLLAQDHSANYWKDAVLDGLEQLYPLCRETSVVRYSGCYFALCAQRWILEDDMKARGIITLTQEETDSRMWVAARQLAMQLQYWQYVLETEQR